MDNGIELFSMWVKWFIGSEGVPKDIFQKTSFSVANRKSFIDNGTSRKKIANENTLLLEIFF